MGEIQNEEMAGFEDLQLEGADSNAASDNGDAPNQDAKTGKKSKTPKTKKVKGEVVSEGPAVPARPKMVRVTSVNDGDLISGDGLVIAFESVSGKPYPFPSGEFDGVGDLVSRTDTRGNLLGDQRRQGDLVD